MKHLSIAALALVASCASLAQPIQRPDYATAAGKPIQGQYIVVFHDRVVQPRALAAQLIQQHGGELLHSYEAALKGFAARLNEAAVEGLRRNPQVAYIEQDQAVSLRQSGETASTQTQNNATWGIDRIDQRSRPLSGTYQYQYTGQSVYAYIIDTGIAPHQEFGSRLLSGVTAIHDGRGTTDCDGHGTHVAGTVGGSTYGVAKGVQLVPVRVLDCSGSGSWSGVIAGVDYVAKDTARRPAVANMSLGGGASSSVNQAVANAVAAGVTMVVAAGNSNADACKYSPASEPSAITVGATTNSDARASYSNFGSCLDLFAPGSAITSAWNTSPTAINTISGTSMAAPHVAGAAALALAANPVATPAVVTDFLINNATVGVVSSAGSRSPNRLLYSMALGTPVTPQIVTVVVTQASGATRRVGNGWNATATFSVKSFDGTNYSALPSPATVTTHFVASNNATHTATCTTDTSDTCSVTSPNYNRSSVSHVTIDVTGVTGSGLSYDAAKNIPTLPLTLFRP
jgi:aqualysin 1